MCKKSDQAALAQLGERQTEDLKAPCSIHGGGRLFCYYQIWHEGDIMQKGRWKVRICTQRGIFQMLSGRQSALLFYRLQVIYQTEQVF